MYIQKCVTLFCLSFLLANSLFAQDLTPFEKDSNQTATYTETIAYYQSLAQKYPKWFRLTAIGMTDAGLPLHVGVMSFDGTFTPAQARQRQKLIFFVNNAIHPGEPEGVDATMMLIRDYLKNPSRQSVLKNLVLVFIPMYNIDGALNRGRISRINQNGPAAYGFRGNARNLDLNRDFIKADSKNAQTFNQIYASWSPHVFMDNHTSNGADYQYTMTLIATQKDKLNSYLAEYQQHALLPRLNKDMKAKGWDLIPYVNFEEKVEGGLMAFPDLPRYSSGYAALHNAIGFIPETHMLKPFPQRVKSTYDLMECLIRIASDDHQKILAARAKAETDVQTRTQFDLSWTLDTTRKETIAFKGFESGYKPSEVSGLPRLYYDRTKPYEKTIPYFPHYKATQSVARPAYYVIPQAYSAVIDRLKWNGVKMTAFARDTLLEAEYYYITDYKSSPNPYEGHHLNREVKVEKRNLQLPYHKGDVVIPTNQPAARYIIETLEPQATDSFFAWNFFDGILNQKEYFSAYVFEDVAAEVLKKNPELRKKLEERKAADPAFAASAAAQLDFVYRNTEYFEPTFRRYPVARVMK
jgi:hypothetical protein